MRIAISAVVGMTVTLSGAAALAQPAVAPGLAAVPPAVSPAVSSNMPAVSPISPVVAPAPPPVLAEEHIDLVGFRDGFFLRDGRDIFRLYPHLLAETDFNSSFGPGTSTVAAPDVASGLEPHLSLHRVRFGFDAELLRRWSLTALVEFGNQPLGNASGAAQTSAAAPGQTPSASSGRYAPVQTVGAVPYATDVFIGYSACRCFNVQLGQLNVPFSLDNRTPDEQYPLLERPVAIRGFVVPSERDLGGLIWGELGPRVFVYELGVFGGDGQNRPSVDARADFIGRVFLRPFAGGATTDFGKYTQIGVSARHGDRDPRSVGYDAPSITTGQGFVLWKPTYTDSQGRLVHVIPSGAQDEIGGELRLQIGRFAFQGEAYYVVNDTREAVDGYQLPLATGTQYTERFGRITGVGWYAQVSAWPFGDAFLTPEPGIFRPRHLDLAGKAPTRFPHGLEMIAIVSGINGSYRGASRLGSAADANTPMSDITVYQAGVAANYWHTRHVHFGVDYMAYVTPSSGTSANQAVVPANLPQQGTASPGAGHVLHELGARLALTF
jgi:Phosphate-selective porin O and P